MTEPTSNTVFALANQKGGVGKTTTALNLAACLTIQHKHVLLIDLDPQANCTSGLGVEKEKNGSIYQVLLGNEVLADKIKPTQYKRLDIVPSEVDLAGAEVDVARSDEYLHRFAKALAPLQAENRYDYILVDCPPSLGILTMNALAACQGVIIPMQSEYFALEGLSVMKSLIERLRLGGANPTLQLEGIVMTMYDKRTNLSRQVAKEVRDHFGETLYDTFIPRSIRLSEAPSYGKAVVDYDPHSNGATAYKHLAREFIRRREAEMD